uniref:Pentatricopeptide repeat-containing protein n=1 Tax=Kalanchoe fedtschenkoi TaxID=63787 RepID=A0A7N0RIB3_KALFE
MLQSAESLLHLLQGSVRRLREVKRIHCALITGGHLLWTSNTSSDKWMPTLLYNALIRCHLEVEKPETSIRLFGRMVVDQVPPNNFTFPSLIKAATFCVGVDHFVGKSFHSHLVRRGVLRDVFVSTSLISFYSQCGDLVGARNVFDEIAEPCIVCNNAMLDAFGKNGDMDGAVSMFELMPERDIVSWTSVISGFGRNGSFEEGVVFFGKMMVDEDVTRRGVRPNEATLVSLLSSCANLDRGGGLYGGKQMHGFIIRNEIQLTVFMATGLISLYGKMGCLKLATQVFNDMACKAICVQNAMISALACNGHETDALDMFERMKLERQKPNEVTLVSVLTACAHAKLVPTGLEVFNSMTLDLGIDPKMEHYGCLVDLLGRAGLLKEANDIIETMPFKADATVLGALLGACKVHGAIELANEVAKKIINLKPQHCGRYVSLSSINAGAERWAQAAELRKEMIAAGIQKIPAYSSV